MDLQTEKTADSKKNRYYLNIEDIKRFLPHRYPYLMVDRVLEIHPTGNLDEPQAGSDKIGTRVVALKNVSYNEMCFQGHFPEFSIFPGVWVLEAMAQAASFALYPYLEKHLDQISKDFHCILVGVDSVRFRKAVVPGDVLRMEIVVNRCRGKLWSFHAEASVEGKHVAEAEILANIVMKKEVEEML